MGKAGALLLKQGKNNSTLFLQGITMSIANPYWTVWWLTIGLGLLLSSSEKGLIGLSFFFTGHILADIIWYSFVSYSISKSKKFLSLKVYKRILGICASIIILFGIYFGISTFKKF
ncbi:MAG TPA: LysE family transporter [bacterium]|nr:LysE family transporter [bacterium]